MDWKRTKLVSFLLHILNPAYTCCEKCGLPWKFCESKSVSTSFGSGTFATCDVCWENSTLKSLKSYYAKVYKKQTRCSIRDGYDMDHSSKHLLKCVEKEYNRTHENGI